MDKPNERLRTLRIRRGLTQSQLALKLYGRENGQGNIASLERGTLVLTPKTLVRILTALNATQNDLEQSEPTPPTEKITGMATCFERGEALRILRKQRGLTLAEVAINLGYQASYQAVLSDIERGLQNVSKNRLENIVTVGMLSTMQGLQGGVMEAVMQLCMWCEHQEGKHLYRNGDYLCTEHYERFTEIDKLEQDLEAAIKLFLQAWVERHRANGAPLDYLQTALECQCLSHFFEATKERA